MSYSNQRADNQVLKRDGFTGNVKTFDKSILLVRD